MEIDSNNDYEEVDYDAGDSVVVDDDDGDDFVDETPKKKSKTSNKRSTPNNKSKSNTKKRKSVQISLNNNNNSNELYDVLLSSIDLRSTVQDWLGVYIDDRNSALETLINCLIKTTGCLQSITKEQSVDYDGIPDIIDQLEYSFKNQTNPMYPLIVKTGNLKKLSLSIQKLLNEIIKCTSDSSSLYDNSDDDDHLMETLLHWTTTLSSSPLRAFRHTATVWALCLTTSLCKLGQDLEKQFSKESNKKRKTEKFNKLIDQKTIIENYVQEITDGVFIHRYRDIEGVIRSECVKSLGNWMKLWPSKFFEGNYLRYTGWLLSDIDNNVRISAIESLVPLYEDEGNLTQLQHFTDRFKNRLIDMCFKDVDLNVRLSSLKVIIEIDNHELLDEDERLVISKLGFDSNLKTRKTSGIFWKNLINDERQKLGNLINNNNDDRSNLENLITIKSLTSLIVKSIKLIDNNNDENDDSNQQQNLQSSRIKLAINDWWENLEIIQDWESMMNVLIDDQSIESEESYLNLLKLNENEENVLVEVFCSCVYQIKHLSDGNNSTNTNKGKKKVINENESNYEKLSRSLIYSFSTLISKHQSVPIRMTDILLIPKYINLTLYLDLRLESQFETLYEEICQQLQKHNLKSVITSSIESILSLNDFNILNNITNRNFNKLTYSLFLNLKNLLSGFEIENSTIEEEKVYGIEIALFRINNIISRINLNDTIGEIDENFFKIMLALSFRGTYSYKIEENMIINSLQFLFLTMLWNFNQFLNLNEDEDEDRYDNFKNAILNDRNDFTNILIDLFKSEKSNASDKIKAKAFKMLIEIQILCSNSNNRSEESLPVTARKLPLEFNSELENDCLEFVENEIEKYSQDLNLNEDNDEEVEENNDDDEDDESDESDVESTPKATDRNRKGKKKNEKKNVNGNERIIKNALSLNNINKSYEFIEMIAIVIKAIRVGVVNIKHLHVILSNSGRFGIMFDNLIKLSLDAVREINLNNQLTEEEESEMIDMLKSSLVNCHQFILEDIAIDENNLVGLARSIASSLVIRGSQLKILKRCSMSLLFGLHKVIINYVIKNLKNVLDNDEGRNRKANDKIMKYNYLFKSLIQLVGSFPSNLINGNCAHEM